MVKRLFTWIYDIVELKTLFYAKGQGNFACFPFQRIWQGHREVLTYDYAERIELSDGQNSRKLV